MIQLPKWAWTILAIVIIIIVFVVLRVDVSIGRSGFHVTQGLIH